MVDPAKFPSKTALTAAPSYKQRKSETYKAETSMKNPYILLRDNQEFASGRRER